MTPLVRFLNAVLHLTLFAVTVTGMLLQEIPVVRRLLRYLGETIRPALRSQLGAAALMLLWGGLVSRGAGVVREMLVASSFGAGSDLDAVLVGLAAPMALHKALRITLTKSSLLADKRGRTGSFE